MNRLAATLLVVLVGAPASAGARYDKVTRASLGRMTGPQAGSTSRNLARFMVNRQAVVETHMDHFESLARRILSARPATLKDPPVKRYMDKMLKDEKSQEDFVRDKGKIFREDGRVIHVNTYTKETPVK